MFRSEFLDDLRTGSRLVTQRGAPDMVLELVHHVSRESAWIHRKRFVQMNAGHLPVTSGRVLAWRGKRAAAIGCRGRCGGFDPIESLEISQAKAEQIRKVQPPGTMNVAESV